MDPCSGKIDVVGIGGHGLKEKPSWTDFQSMEENADRNVQALLFLIV